jgi:hypothetical protein
MSPRYVLERAVHGRGNLCDRLVVAAPTTRDHRSGARARLKRRLGLRLVGGFKAGDGASRRPKVDARTRVLK